MPDIVATIPGANTCQTFDDLNSILGRQVNFYLNLPQFTSIFLSFFSFFKSVSASCYLRQKGQREVCFFGTG